MTRRDVILQVRISEDEQSLLRDEAKQLDRSVAWVARARMFPAKANTSGAKVLKHPVVNSYGDTTFTSGQHTASTGVDSSGNQVGPDSDETTLRKVQNVAVAPKKSEFVAGAESSAAAPKLNQTLAAQKSRDDILRSVNRKSKT